MLRVNNPTGPAVRRLNLPGTHPEALCGYQKTTFTSSAFDINFFSAFYADSRTFSFTFYLSQSHHGRTQDLVVIPPLGSDLNTEQGQSMKALAV